MVEPIPFSIPPIKVQIAAVRKVVRKPNPRNEEKITKRIGKPNRFKKFCFHKALRMAKMAKR